MLSPILLFVYNRPAHTQQVLEALQKNDLADQSILYVFADGPRHTADESELLRIKQVRALVKSKNWCKELRFSESDSNIGCADSIVRGVSKVVNEHGKVIVLEDDIIMSAQFLRYMNDALDLFEADQRMGSVNAYADDLPGIDSLPPYFLLDGADCWGWGTWKDRWERLITDAGTLMETLVKLKLEKKFEYGGQLSLLQKQIEGTIDCWDILWHGTQIVNNQKGLFPNSSFVKNIGTDGSGTHGDFNEMLFEEQTVQLNEYKLKLSEIDHDQLFAKQSSIEKHYRKIRLDKIYAYKTFGYFVKSAVKSLTGLDRKKLDHILKPFQK